MESTDQGTSRRATTRPLHLSLDPADPPASRSGGSGVSRRRTMDHSVRNQGHLASAHRVDPYRASRRNSASHQGQASYPTSARYYASNASTSSSHSHNNASSNSVGSSHHSSNVVSSSSIGTSYSTNFLHHPLQHQVLPSSTYHASSASQRNNQQSSHAQHDLFSQPQGLTSAVRYTLKLQAQKVADKLVNHQPSRKSRRGRRSRSRRGLSAVWSIIKSRKLDTLQNLFILVVPILLFLYISHRASKHAVKHIPIFLDKATRNAKFAWRPNRRLNNRQCTLNMFIEKQAYDEFNPDFEEIKPGEKNKDGTLKVPKPPPFEKGGTYRTKGQMAVIQRFISSVADSFRPQAKIQQHLVFAGSRDGGHLAETALKFWPARGFYTTQLYIIPDAHEDHSVKPKSNSTSTTTTSNHLHDHSNRALQYGALSSIEERFQNHALSDQIHIYDSEGQRAGLVRNDLDDDDVVQLKQEEMFELEDDRLLTVDVFDDDAVLRGTSRRTSSYNEDSEEQQQSSPGYFSIKKLLSPHLDILDEDPNSLSRSISTRAREGDDTTADDDDKKKGTKHTIPYFHVDGRSAAQKFEILESAKPLLLDNTIVTMGVENSPDIDPFELIDFFREVNYKTFFLGKRQIMRIDHLCPEILEQVISHPFLDKKEISMMRKVLQYFRIIPKEKDAHIVHPHPENIILYPAFFVALPRGRHSKEEMTIQHMYDLFGGGGGGGQIATANDRKAPGKKKKK